MPQPCVPWPRPPQPVSRCRPFSAFATRCLLAGMLLAPPDPGDLPNNHLMYAGQWFFFALTALVIYLLALRKRRRG